MRPAVTHDDVTESGVIVAGNELRYLRAGDSGPPVLLLHGGIVDAAHLSWGHLLGPLAADHRVYALDLLGYGLSDTPPGPYTTERHVEVVESFLDLVDLDAVHAVGTSLGGGVALGLALQSPERVLSVVGAPAFGLGTELPNGAKTFLLSRVGLLNRAGIALAARSRRLASASLDTVVRDPDELPEELHEAFYRELQRPDAGAAYRSWRKQEVRWGGWATYYHTRLDELTVPALFLHGTDDDVFPARWSERAADRAPDAEAELLPGRDHWLPRDAPEAVEQSLLGFLDEAA